MEIIKHGTLPDKRKYFICDKCGCQFVADAAEYRHDIHRNEDFYSCKCPDCGKNCILEE